MTTTYFSTPYDVYNDNTSMEITQAGMGVSIGVKWPLLPVKIFLATFGLICNSLIFVGLAEWNKKLRTLDALLLNIAIWDTAFLSSRIGQQITQALLAICNDWSIGGKLYFIHQMFNYTARTCFVISMLATVSVAVERYLHSFMPLTMSPHSNRTRTRLIVSTVLCLSLAVSLPELVVVICVYHVYIDRVTTDTLWSVCCTTSYNYVVKSGVLLRLCVKCFAWVSLLILDSVLIRRLLAGARSARRMYNEDRGHVNHPRCYNEKSLTVAVMMLVTLSLVAYPVTGFVWVSTYASAGWSGVLDPRAIPDIQEAGKVVQLVYASSNLFFLLMFGKRFRHNLFNRISMCQLDFVRARW